MRIYIGVALAIATIGCEPAPDRRSVAAVEVRGDTTFVSITSDTSATHHLQSDLILGSVGGQPEEAFGEIRALHVDAQGRILLFDGLEMSVKRFSPSGEYAGTIGQRGQGPGEFDFPWDLSTDVNGRILIAEYIGRVLAFNDSGDFLVDWRVPDWQSPAQASPQSAIAGNDDGTIGVLGRVGGNPNDHRLYIFDAAGAVQATIAPHVPWLDEVQSGHMRPSMYVAWSPARFGVTSVSSRLGFEVFRPDESEIVRVEHSAEPAEFASAEREEWGRYAEWVGRRMQRPSAFPPPMPFKPQFKSIVLARTGEIWLVRHTHARRNPNAADSIMGFPAAPDWLEPFRAEVYTNQGEHLASVAGPEDFRLFFASGDTLWGVQRGDFSEPYVMRMILDEPLPERRGLSPEE